MQFLAQLRVRVTPLAAEKEKEKRREERESKLSRRCSASVTAELRTILKESKNIKTRARGKQ